MRRSTLLTSTIALAAAALLWACRDVTPPQRPGPGGAASADMSPNGDAHSAQARALSCSKRAAQHGQATIGSHGGRIRLGRNALIVPPGALAGPVDITANVPADTVEEIQLQPHGLQFAKPVTLVFDATGCAIGYTGEVNVGYIDNDGVIKEWLEGKYLAPYGVVVTKIHHFSGYILMF